MAAIVKLFGWLSVIIGIVSVIIGIVGFLDGGPFFSRWAGLLPLGASALLSGALLIVFARIVELLEEMNEKLSPIFTIATALESNYRPQLAPEVQSMSETDILNSPPPGAKAFKYKNRRVVQLSDTTIVAETLTGGAKRFSSLKEFQNFIE